MGITYIVHDPIIIRALNPYYAYKLLSSSTSGNAFIVLGAVFLCTTGAEALYSDLGIAVKPISASAGYMLKPV